MDPAHLMPAYQALPFPVPSLLSQILLVAGLYLHVLPMNVVLGGGFICVLMFLKGRNDRSCYSFRAAKNLATSLPIFISFAITQGIVPLLFVQLIYGPAFYTSSILIAVPWLAIIALVLISYYIAYLVVYKFLGKESDDNPGKRAAVSLLVMGVGFALTAFVFSNNMTLMLTPEKWAQIYQSGPYGMHLNTSEPMLVPRYLHFLLASFAVSGIALGCFGLYFLRREEQFGRWLIRTGSHVFLGATLLNIPVGLWFLLKGIKPEFVSNFLGGSPPVTYVFGTSIVLLLAALLFTAVSARNANKTAFVGGLVSAASLILMMIINRHNLRVFYLDPFLKPQTVPVAMQWDLLLVFLVAAVGLIAYLTWLGRLVWSAHCQSPPAEGGVTE